MSLTINNAQFNHVAKMFGGESNIPKSVLDAMKLRDYGKAGTAEAKDAAVKAFACDYAITVRDTVQSMSIYLLQASSLKINEPSTFASAVTDVLFDSFDALTDGLDDGDKKALLSDAHSVATGELNLNFMSALWPPNVVEAIVNDAKNLGGDGDYQIEIGV